MKKTLPFTERILYLALSTCFAGSTLFFACQAKNLRADVAQEKHANRYLAAHLEASRQTSLSHEEVETLRKNGLRQPVADLLADLKKHPPRIPQRGVLGGTMGFHDAADARFLGDGWVFAGFDDGHILGKALLKYEVKSGGRISWKLVGSFLE